MIWRKGSGSADPLLPGHPKQNKLSSVIMLACVAVAVLCSITAYTSHTSQTSRAVEMVSVDKEVVSEKKRLSQITAEDDSLKQEAAALSSHLKAMKSAEALILQKKMKVKARQLRAKVERAEKEHNALLKRIAEEKFQAQLIQHDIQTSALATDAAVPRNVKRDQLHLKRTTEQLVGSYVKICNAWGCKVTYKPESDEDMTWYAGHNKTASWPGSGNEEMVTGNHILYPLGPAMRENLTRIQLPPHDIVPKRSKLGDNWFGFGHGDAFVRADRSAMAAAGNLPPWKRGPSYNFNNYDHAAKPMGIGGPLDRRAAAPTDWAESTHDAAECARRCAAAGKAAADCAAGCAASAADVVAQAGDADLPAAAARPRRRCPLNPDGSQPRDCLGGGDGVDGVYEASPLSPAFFDPNRALMEQHGVAVDAWPFGDPQRHKWGGDAVDRAKEVPAKYFDYDGAERPTWAFNNHALRSLPQYADPEGPANKQLMLGSTWNDKHKGLPDLDDSWVPKRDFAKQIMPAHTETAADDHLGNWTHDSPANLRLLYGASRLFNGLRPRAPDDPAAPPVAPTGKKAAVESDPTVEADPWSLGDVPLPTAEYADLLGSDTARTGDPLHDIRTGWSGQNGVAAVGVDIDTGVPVGGQRAQSRHPVIGPSPGRASLERLGVNVGGQW